MWTPATRQATPAAKPTKPTKAGKPGRSAPPPPRRRWVTVVKWLAISAFAGLILLVGTVAFVFWMYGRDPNLPDYKKLSDYHPKQVTSILDANDRRIGELFEERRTVVPYDKIPRMVVDAFVAAEDNSFWDHGGVDYWGMFRAFITNLRERKAKQGASTITQQVVKTFLLSPEKTFKRKIQEIIIARRLEHALTKEEIMMLYLNQIYFGHGRYGIQEASRFYFGKDVSRLSVGEIAILAGLPQSPENISPRKNPTRAKERQTYVLNQLVGMNKISRAEAQKFIDAPIQIVKEPFPELGSGPEWVDLVRRELIATKCAPGESTCKAGEKYLETLGAAVRTSLDPTLQAHAQQALQVGLRAVDKRKKTARPIRSIKPDQIDKEVARLASKLGKGPSAREIYDAVVTEVHDGDHEIVVDLGNWKAAIALDGEEDARFNPPEPAKDGKGDAAPKKPSERFKVGDVLEVVTAPASAPAGKHAKRRVAFAPGPEGAVVVIELKTRKVRALVGGYASKVAGFNRATMAKRQPGSSFKPFVYAAAIESKKATAGTRMNDAPEVYDLWRPKNYDSKFAGPLLLRTALAKSINTIAIKLTHDVTPDAVAELARRMGIHSKLPREMSLALGSGEVTPLEMTNAIATLGAGGMAVPPRFIEAIDGKATAPVAGERVLSEQSAYIVTDMMRSVVTSGSGHLAQALKIPVAGKTGTSNDARDTWFIGMTPDYAIGVWVGYDDNRSMGKEAGGTTATPIFVDVAKSMNLPAKSFVRPAGIVEAKIAKAGDDAGKLAPEDAPPGTAITEIYLEGTAPTEVAAKAGDVTDQNLVQSSFEED
ncbi:MAG: penicillin-binding protein 1A [Kofleriaceae bacterium]